MVDFPELPSESLTDVLDAINAIDVEEHLVRSSELGVLNFASGREVFSTARRVSLRVRGLPVEEVAGTPGYANLRERFAELHARLRDVAKFDPTTGDAGARREQAIAAVREATSGALTAFMPLAGYLLVVSGGIGDVQAQLDAAVQQWQQSAKAQIAESERLLGDAITLATTNAATAEAAARAAQTAAGQTGVAEHSRVFAEEADRHATESGVWLLRTIFAAAALVAATALLIWLVPVGDDLQNPRVVQLILLKGLVVSLGLTAIVLCMKMFRTERHLFVVNRHRELALRTFQTFAEGAHTDPIRDAVLLEATRAVFAPGSTGLLEQGAPSSSPMALLEVFRGQSPRPPEGS